MSAINKINVDNVSYNIEDSRVDNIADAIPTASTEQKGLVQIGQGINVDENGVISVEASGGDSVSYTDAGNVTNPVTIGQININGTDYNINAPAAYYNNYVSGQTTAVGQIHSGSVLGGQEIFVPAVMYEDQIQGSHVLGQLVVGGDSYPITYTPAASGDSVQFNSLLASGTQIGTITINGVETAIYAPAGGSGGGSTVSYQDLTIASDPRVAVGMITIDGAGYNIYVPTLTSVDWNDITGIPIDITKSLSVTPTLASGTKIADVAWYDDEQGSRTAELYAPEQEQADWNETVTTSKAYIANKPTIPTKTSELLNDSGFARSENLALVAGTGDYNDLTNKPTIPTVTVTQTLASGTKIGEIDVSGTTTELFAPAGGSGGSTDWADITGNKPYLYQGYKLTSVQQSPTQYTPSTLPGYGTAATGDYSIAIGYDTQATNHCSLAVGGSTRSKGMWAVATGDGTIAAGDRQIAAGTYNAEDANNYFAFMVGNGDYKSGGSTTIRKNAEATAWNGNKYIEGDLYVGCTDWATVNSSSSGTGKPELVTENAGGKRVLTEDDAVTVTQTLATGTKIAEIDVGGTSTDIYAPAGSATDWADITNKPDITPVAGRDGINNIAGLGGSINQAQGVNPKGTIVIGDSARSSADNAIALGAGATVTGLNGAAIGWGAQAGRDSVALGTGSQARSYGAALGSTTAASQYQTAIGYNNITDANGQFGLIVGNGITGDGSILPSSDAMAIGFDGTQYLAGDLYVNCTDFTTTSNGLTTANAGGTKVATLSDIKADWAITDASVVGYIANKPNINAGTGLGAIKEGSSATASGSYSHAEGNRTVASGNYSHTEGSGVTASGQMSHAEGSNTQANGQWSHAEGQSSQAGKADNSSFGEAAHAEGNGTRAYGNRSHAEGSSTTTGSDSTSSDGYAAHAEGDRSQAMGNSAHAEGYVTKAYGNYSHAEGSQTTASSESTHAEGYSTTASGVYSHAEGSHSTASAWASHAEGEFAQASGRTAHAEGNYTIASSQLQHVQGKYNTEDSNNIFADIIGNGDGAGSLQRKNAEATDWNGNKYLSGGIYVGCTNYTTAANGLTTLGAGGFRIDMAPDNAIVDPTEPDETISEDLVMIDTITKTMGSEMQEDPETGDMVPVATTVTTTHQRNWTAFPKEYTARDLARDAKSLDEMEPENWDSYGTYTLQIWGVRRYADDGEGNFTEYCAPVYKWVKTADNTPRDETDPTTEEEPTE